MFERPYALWAAILVVVPWLLLKLPPIGATPRKFLLPTMRLVASTNLRARRRRRRLLRAASRSLAILALVGLWAAPLLKDVDSVADDHLASDTREHINAPSALLIVDGSDVGSKRTALAAADYLTLALDAQFDELRYDRVHSLDFAARPKAVLRSYDAIIIVDVDAIATAEEEAIAEFLDAGGRVLLCASETILTDRWNETLKRWNLNVNVAEASLKQVPSTSTPLSLTERSFLVTFPGGDTARVNELPASRAFPCVGESATTILRDRPSNVPVYSKLKSNLCWFAIPITDASAALAANPIFPTLVERLLLWTDDAMTNSLTAEQDAHARSRRLLSSIPTFLWLVLILAILVEFIDPSLRGTSDSTLLKETRDAI